MPFTIVLNEKRIEVPYAAGMKVLQTASAPLFIFTGILTGEPILTVVGSPGMMVEHPDAYNLMPSPTQAQ